MNATDTATQAEKFNTLMHAEREVQLMQTIVDFRGAGLSDYQAGRQQESLEAAKGRLAKAWDALTLDELRAYGEFRKA